MGLWNFTDGILQFFDTNIIFFVVKSIRFFQIVYHFDCENEWTNERMNGGRLVAYTMNLVGADYVGKDGIS